MAVNPLLRSSQLRLIGLSSNMDTDSIVQQMMRIHQLKIDSQFRSKTLLQWKQQSLKGIEDQLQDFRRSFLTQLGASAMMSTSVYNSTKASFSKETSAFTISTSVGTPVGSIKIGQIASLAAGTKVTTVGSASRSGDGFKLTDKLGNISPSTGNITWDSRNEAYVNINGVNITLHRGDRLEDINRKISANGVNQQIVFNDNLVDSEGNRYANVSINGKRITVFEHEFFSTDNDKAICDIVGLNYFDTARVNINDIELDINKNSTLGSLAGALGGSVSLDYAKVNINGKDVILNQNDTFADINDKIVAAGGTALAPVSGGNVTANINGVDVTFNLGAISGDIFGGINAEILSAGGDPDQQITFDMAKVSLGIGGMSPTGSYNQDIFINASELSSKFGDIYEELNDRVVAAGGGTGFAPIRFEWADITVHDSVAGTDYTVQVRATDNAREINKKIRDQELISYDILKLDGTDSIIIGGDTKNLAASDYTRVLPKSFGDTGILERINYTQSGNNITGLPRFLNFDQNGRAAITINGVSITLNREMTIEDMLNTVSSSAAHVNMTYDRLSDQFTIENKNVGNYNLTVGGLEAFGIANGTYTGGSYARVWIENGEYNGWVESNSNTIKLRGGVTLELKETTAADDMTTVTFKRDTTDAVEKIRNFVEAYNSLVKRLEDMLKETKSQDERTYKPLTDEEKSLMSEKQIEEWEEIAKKGLLKNDAGLQSLTTGLRNLLFDQIKSAGLSPTQIGLTTGKWEDGTGGQIMLDETKLAAALEADPERVASVFMGGGDDEKGFLKRMDDMIYGYVFGNQANSINHLENSIRRANEQMDKMQQKMWAEEDKLYKKFAAMETALSKLQSQTDWMTAMLGMNNNNGK